jgi:hypothetical protein
MFYPPIIVKNKMKAFITSALLVFIIGNIGAADIESYEFIDHLRTISRPGTPEIFQDSVLFTAPSSYRRVGISFAHDGYSKVYWLKQLMLPRDSADFTAKGKVQRKVDQTFDSGVMFHLEQIPENIKNMDYRMIIDGLWTTDPLNPLKVSGSSGIVESRVPLPVTSPGLSGTYRNSTLGYPESTLAYRFSFNASPGETVTVGGSFNNWDPFMYELKEVSPGFYTLQLPLPPGTYEYVFFYRGEQVPDPANFRRLYTREGAIASEAVVAQ